MTFPTSALSLVGKLAIAVFAAMFVVLALGGLAIASQDACEQLAGGVLPYGALLCSGSVVVNIGLLKVLLPLHIDAAWRGSKLAAVMGALLWLCMLGFSWGTVVLTFPFDRMSVAIAAIAVVGWLLVELAGGLLPMIAAAQFMLPVRSTEFQRLPSPSPRPQFDNVKSLLEHAFTHGAEGLDGLRLEAGTIICSQSTLARHAVCSKTEAHRQLRRLVEQGTIRVMTTKNRTIIQRAESPPPTLA